MHYILLMCAYSGLHAQLHGFWPAEGNKPLAIRNLTSAEAVACLLGKPVDKVGQRWGAVRRISYGFLRCSLP
jgi:hypothetical protein